MKISIELKQHAINALKERLEEKEMNRYANAPVKEGYIEALRVLNDNVKYYSEIKCKTVQGRAIAALAIDFLQGNENLETLIRVPIRGGVKVHNVYLKYAETISSGVELCHSCGVTCRTSTLFRSNPKGEPGIFLCKTCLVKV